MIERHRRLAFRHRLLTTYWLLNTAIAVGLFAFSLR